MQIVISTLAALTRTPWSSKNVHDELHTILRYDTFTYWMKKRQLRGVLRHVVFEQITINALVIIISSNKGQYSKLVQSFPFCSYNLCCLSQLEVSAYFFAVYV